MKISECTKFPVIGKSRKTDLVVKFTNYIRGGIYLGVCLKAGNNVSTTYSVGSEYWWDISQFYVVTKKLKYRYD